VKFFVPYGEGIKIHQWMTCSSVPRLHIAHLRQQCHNSKCVIFQERILQVLKCYTRNFLWVQWRHTCSPAASFANSVITLYLLKVHLQTFLSVPVTQKMTNFELWHSCRKWAIWFIREHFCFSLPSVLPLYLQSMNKHSCEMLGKVKRRAVSKVRKAYAFGGGGGTGKRI
jgi:hypothetical protein